MIYTYKFSSLIGLLYITADDEAVISISLNSETAHFSENDVIKNTVFQLKEYFEGKRKLFDLPLKLTGTAFQKSVWEELRKIPYGAVRSYKQIAASIGKPNAQRAVGNANNKNHIPIIIPCHRVIGNDGKLSGYAYGTDIKKKLLQIEGYKC